MGNIVSMTPKDQRTRAGEYDAPEDRTNRYIHQDSGWYYKTRESRTIGPYPKRSLAEQAAIAFANFAQTLTDSQLQHLVDSHMEALQARSLGMAVQQVRMGEWQTPEYRSPRVYQHEQCWYFKTREGRVIGPHESEAEAMATALTFTRFAMVIHEGSVDNLIDTMNEDLSSD